MLIHLIGAEQLRSERGFFVKLFSGRSGFVKASLQAMPLLEERCADFFQYSGLFLTRCLDDPGGG
jgi:hypothetical protein